MRALVLLVSLAALSVSAQDVPTGLTVGAGYASGFEGVAIHTEARARFAGSGWGLEPSLSWTRELPYTRPVLDSGFYVGGCPEPCTRRFEGEQAVAVGMALAYRTVARGLEVHAGAFGQRVLPVWDSRSYRAGLEVGAAVPVGRIRLGADVQVARLTGDRRTSVAPVVRLALGR
ncbi:hypothetical protein [Rubrivirga sp.]|uniref:hypothetical protein n=1 Tax=Rubrivirga sp. TaxID=1885344 RepID=UPI003C72CCA1